MFIETVPNRTSPPAILLRESYRDEAGKAQKGAIQSDAAYSGDSALGGVSTDGDSENEWRSSVCVS
jgi:hypothetical protein